MFQRIMGTHQFVISAHGVITGSTARHLVRICKHARQKSHGSMP